MTKQKNTQNPTQIRVTNFQARDPVSDEFYRDLRSVSNPMPDQPRYPWVSQERSMTMIQCTDEVYHREIVPDEEIIPHASRVTPLTYDECILTIFELGTISKQVKLKERALISERILKILDYNTLCVQEELNGMASGSMKMYGGETKPDLAKKHSHLHCTGNCQFAISSREAGPITLRLQQHEKELIDSFVVEEVEPEVDTLNQIGVCHGLRHIAVQENMRPLDEDVVVDMGVGQGGYMDHFQTSNYYGVEENITFCAQAVSRMHEQLKDGDERVLLRNNVQNQGREYQFVTEVPDVKVDTAYFTYSIADYVFEKRDSFEKLMRSMNLTSHIVVIVSDTQLQEGEEAMVGPAFIRRSQGVNHVKFGRDFSKTKLETPWGPHETQRLFKNYGYRLACSQNFSEVVGSLPRQQRRGLTAYYKTSFAPQEWMEKMHYMVFARRAKDCRGKREMYCVECGEVVSREHLMLYGHRGKMIPTCCPQVRFCHRCLVFECKCQGSCAWRCTHHRKPDCQYCGHQHCNKCANCSNGVAVPYHLTKNIRGLESGLQKPPDEVKAIWEEM